MLNPDELSVETFQTSATSNLRSTDPVLDCCTGCTSGCGINPTAIYCESASGDAVCPAEPATVID